MPMFKGKPAKKKKSASQKAADVSAKGNAAKRWKALQAKGARTGRSSGTQQSTAVGRRKLQTAKTSSRALSRVAKQQTSSGASIRAKQAATRKANIKDPTYQRAPQLRIGSAKKAGTGSVMKRTAASATKAKLGARNPAARAPVQAAAPARGAARQTGLRRKAGAWGGRRS